jgi:hypothetical protein
MSDGPSLFDVGVVALAHAATPVSETARSYVADAIEGTIDAIVPYPSLFGAHIVLTNYYGFSTADASRLLSNFADARRVHWYDELPESTVRAGFDLAATHNIDGWDGYYLNRGESPAVYGGRESDTSRQRPRPTLTPGYPP